MPPGWEVLSPIKVWWGDRMLGNDKFMARAGKMGIKTIHISEIMVDQLTLTGSTNLGESSLVER